MIRAQPSNPGLTVAVSSLPSELGLSIERLKVMPALDQVRPGRVAFGFHRSACSRSGTFSYHFMPPLGIELTSVVLHLQQGTFFSQLPRSRLVWVHSSDRKLLFTLDHPKLWRDLNQALRTKCSTSRKARKNNRQHFAVNEQCFTLQHCSSKVHLS